MGDLEALMFTLAAAGTSKDGDCIRSADAVAAVLARNDVVCIPLLVVGESEFMGATCISFLHHVTGIVGGDELWIVDLTATQFHPDLPNCWVTAEKGYLSRLGSVTGYTVRLEVRGVRSV